MLFSILLQLISSGYMVHVQFSALGSCGSFVLFSMGGVEFWSFFVWNLQSVSPLKLIFSENPSVFVHSVYIHEALKLRLHVVALPASLVMSWPAEITLKLNRSGLDILVLVLQSSNSFFWLIFSILLQSISSWLHGSCSAFAFRVLWFFCFVLQKMIWFFVFLVWYFQTVPL